MMARKHGGAPCTLREHSVVKLRKQKYQNRSRLTMNKLKKFHFLPVSLVSDRTIATRYSVVNIR
jgi:hypothetical protein